MDKKSKKKYLFVFGTRPEAIKMAPIITEFQKNPESIEYEVCVTAQHREMLDQVLSFFDIKPNYDLNVMKKGQDLNSLSAAILDGLALVFKKSQPDAILVQGDTTTSTIASLAAFYARIKVFHVEAGLRTYDRNAPYPEEINRQVTARIADVHFAPTSSAKQHLLDEGISPDRIWVTGNTVIDAVLMARDLVKRYKSDTLEKLNQSLNPSKKIILVTGHRRESFGEGFRQICLALKQISERNDVQIVYPVHLNPKVQEPVYSLLGDIENVLLIDPLPYPEFVWLMEKCHIILTDSGGIQEEGPSLDKPVLVMRKTTERMEAIEAGTALLVGTKQSEIIESVEKLLNNTVLYEEMIEKKNPFGDGTAATQIVDVILNA